MFNEYFLFFTNLDEEGDEEYQLEEDLTMVIKNNNHSGIGNKTFYYDVAYLGRSSAEKSTEQKPHKTNVKNRRKHCTA